MREEGIGPKAGQGQEEHKPTVGIKAARGWGYSNSDIWELCFEGFHLFAGKEWQYRIKSQDGARNRKSTPWRNFVIDERAAADGDDDEESAEEEEETEDAAEESSEDEETELAAVLVQEVRDKDWPHGGKLLFLSFFLMTVARDGVLSRNLAPTMQVK